MLASIKHCTSTQCDCIVMYLPTNTAATNTTPNTTCQIYYFKNTRILNSLFYRLLYFYFIFTSPSSPRPSSPNTPRKWVPTNPHLDFFPNLQKKVAADLYLSTTTSPITTTAVMAARAGQDAAQMPFIKNLASSGTSRSSPLNACQSTPATTTTNQPRDNLTRQKPLLCKPLLTSQTANYEPPPSKPSPPSSPPAAPSPTPTPASSGPASTTPSG